MNSALKLKSIKRTMQIRISVAIISQSRIKNKLSSDRVASLLSHVDTAQSFLNLQP